MKILIVVASVAILVAVVLTFVKQADNKKGEVRVSEEQQVIDAPVNSSAEDSQQDSEPSRGSTSDTPSNTPRSNLDDSAGKNNSPIKPISNNDSIKIVDRLVNFGFEQSSGRAIDTIIIHSTYDAVGNDPFSVAGVIAEYKSYGVSPHYLIGRDGAIYRLVEDKNIAYHAGVAQTPDGRSNVNDFSIGIELINTKTDKISDAQYASLNNLIAQLKSKYKIKYVLGHNQIAPSRKDDPWNFDWKEVK